MANKNLVIVESPAKAKTIGKILGNEYDVRSSKGHVRDLPVNRLGVNVEKHFEPQYVVSKSRKKIVSELKKAAEKADAVYLCPDPDREGEAIAWHLQEILKDTDRPFYRVQYNEITPRAVRAAFENPGALDMRRVDAQQARRILDRIVGYKVSPLLWRRIRGGLSAGRVQSVALKLVCEREKEIKNFVPEAYWLIGALVRKLVMPLDPFRVKLLRIDDKKAEIKSEERAVEIRRDLAGRDLTVAAVKTRETSRKAPPPFITSTLQQAASSRYNYSPNRTMSIAQKLYEGVDFGSGPVGLITYMRTDSVNVAADARDACRGYISQTYGKDYLPDKPNIFRSRSSAQEAHEAIRPTDVTRTPDSLKGKLDASEMKVYDLIWRRLVASQMAPARIRQRTVEVATDPREGALHNYLFSATSSDVTFPGYMKVSGMDRGKKKPRKKGDNETGEAEETQDLPALGEGERLSCVEWLSERKETQPPPRFSEASLVRELERNGVGRPSTYAATVSTLSQRKYVTREKRTLAPTDLGMQVNDLLQKSLPKLFEVGFTADMEAKLDRIEEGDAEWTTMLDAFYGRFKEWVDAARGPDADTEAVDNVLGMMESVSEWAPPVKRGKRTFSDEKFVASVRKQRTEGKKAISQRQLEALVKMAARYKDQIPGAAKRLTDMGFAELLKAPDVAPPKKTTREKLALLADIDLDEQTAEFVQSLAARVEGGRSLTRNQLAALDRVVVGHAARIPNLEARREELGLPEKDEERGETVRLLVDALQHVTEWNEPVKKGKRTFDDKAFFESLQGQFTNRGSLSPRQTSALKRLAARYKSQIPNYEELTDKVGLKTKPKKKQADGTSE